MNEKYVHNFIIVVLIVIVVILSIVASKSEHFGVASIGSGPDKAQTAMLSARLRGNNALPALSARLRGDRALPALSARLRDAGSISGIKGGALPARILTGTTDTIENFRGVGAGNASSTLAAHIKKASDNVMGSTSTAEHFAPTIDFGATKMHIRTDSSNQVMKGFLVQ